MLPASLHRVIGQTTSGVEPPLMRTADRQMASVNRAGRALMDPTERQMVSTRSA